MKKKSLLVSFFAWILPSVVLAQYSAEPSKYTRAFNDSVAHVAAAFGDQDFKDAKRGFIATLDVKTNPKVNGKQLYDLHSWDFLKGEAPATVNPVLWRQAQLNSLTGLYEVVPNKIWQVRGLDIANITFIRSKTGVIVIDTGTSSESAQTAYSLLKQHIGDLPLRAVVITHSHIDHFGGLQGILQSRTNLSDSIPIIAPQDYFNNSQTENVLAGIPMSAHSKFMFGGTLPRSAKGFVTAGLGSSLSQTSFTNTLLPATREIAEPEESIVIDGLQLDFWSAPDSEAPSEMLVYIPQYHALQSAEDINHTLHNLLTPRGAKIRNGLLWSKYIDNVISKYGNDVEVSLGSHNWPVWDNKNVVTYWEKQRDLYRYIHDHTLYLANKGYTPDDISHYIKLPRALASYSADREYYGSVSFNARSQYELYFGFFDGNPANLNPLSPAIESKKIVEAIGGEDKAVAIAQKAYDQGDYRWASTLLNKVVFANPSCQKARNLLASAYTQLGYQAESAPWRNFYLTGAKELLSKDNVKTFGKRYLSSALSPDQFFDVIATRINGYAYDQNDLNINIFVTDSKEKLSVIYKNGVLSNRKGSWIEKSDVTLEITKGDLFTLFTNETNVEHLRSQNKLKVEGDIERLNEFLSHIEQPQTNFNIVEPQASYTLH